MSRSPADILFNDVDTQLFGDAVIETYELSGMKIDELTGAVVVLALGVLSGYLDIIVARITDDPVFARERSL